MTGFIEVTSVTGATIYPPLPPVFKQGRATPKIHRISLGPLFKVLFAQDRVFYVYSLETKSFTVIDTKSLPLAFSIAKIVCTPDCKYMIVFPTFGNVYIFYYVSDCNQEPDDPRSLNTYQLLRPIPLLSISWYYLTVNGSGFYKLVVNHFGKLRQHHLILDKANMRKEIVKTMSMSRNEIIIVESANATMTVTIQGIGDETAIYIYCKRVIIFTMRMGIEFKPPYPINVFFLGDYCIFYSNSTYVVFNLRTRTAVSFYSHDMTIKSITYHRHGNNILILFSNGTVRIHVLETGNYQQLPVNDITHIGYMTKNVIWLDDNVSYQCFHIGEESQITKHLRETQRHGGHLAVHENSSCFWVDMNHWPSGDLPLAALMRAQRYEINYPGYEAGMNKAFSLVLAYAKEKRRLSFAMLMELHKALMSPIEYGGVAYGLTTRVAFVREREGHIFPMTDACFMECLDNRHANIQYNGRVLKRSREPISFSVEVRTGREQVIDIIGFDPSQSDLKPDRIEFEVNKIIEKTFYDGQKGEAIIVRIVNLVRILNLFHLVADGNGRLSLLTLFYLLYSHDLPLSLLFSPILIPSSSCQELADHILVGRRNYSFLCQGKYDAIKESIASQYKHACKTSNLFKSRTIGERRLPLVEYCLRRGFPEKFEA